MYAVYNGNSMLCMFQLLKYNAEERLGAGVGGVDDIKMHPFFSGVDWSLIQA